MKSIIFLFFALTITFCENPKSDLPEEFSYEIIKEEPNLKLSKNNIEIKLSKKVNEKTLKKIALDIRRDRQRFDKLWVFYYIPDMSQGMAWATTHFTPRLDVQINGSTEEEDILTSEVSGIDGEVMGKWRCEKSLMGATLILYRVPDGGLKMKINFKDGGVIESHIVQSEENDVTRYDDGNVHGEFYRLEAHGNLGLYGRDGKYDEAIKID